MFKIIRKLFKTNKKAADTPHINDRENYLVNNLIRFNSNRFGQLFQARKWGK